LKIYQPPTRPPFTKNISVLGKYFVLINTLKGASIRWKGRAQAALPLLPHQSLRIMTKNTKIKIESPLLGTKATKLQHLDSF
jgi:hypothetical protein